MLYSSYIDRLERKLNKKYKPSEDFFTCSGDSIQPTREYRVIDGIKQLVITGKHNMQDEIESYAESCDINVVINKFLNGDTSVLNPSAGTYGDFRDCPTTYAEMFDRVQLCKNVFDQMPVEIKEKFDNSSEKFWTSFGSSYFDDVFNEYNKSFDPEVVSVPDEVAKGVNNAE